MQLKRRLKGARALSVEELHLLFEQLTDPFRTMVVVCVCLGLRASELLALKWEAFDWKHLKIRVDLCILNNHADDAKTESSRASLPLAPEIAEILQNWRRKSPYSQGHDWVFASPSRKGDLPYASTAVLRQHISPAALRAGIVDPIGWHTFRHTCSTLLHQLQVDIKVQQLLMRYANIHTTLRTHTHVVPEDLRNGNRKLVQVVLGTAKNRNKGNTGKKAKKAA